MTAWKDGSEITVDPNNVVVNAAGTNMTVATYPEKQLTHGNKQPVFELFRTLEVGEKNQKKLESIFQIEAAKIRGRVKSTKTALRSEKKFNKVERQLSAN